MFTKFRPQSQQYIDRNHCEQNNIHHSFTRTLSLVFVYLHTLPIEPEADSPFIDKRNRTKEQEMALLILLLIISIPVIELSVLIDVGGEIGAISTVLLCLLTAAVGLTIVRLQGMQVFSNMQNAARTGEPVGENLIHGFFLLISGLFLLIPGFVTDALGALLLVPFIRVALGKFGLAHIVVRSHTASTQQSNTIDGEFWESDENTPETPFKTINSDDLTKNHEEK